MKQSLILILLTFSFTSIGQVRLNEMQSSNATTIIDNFGESDDWVEIYNPTMDTIEIGGLVLKDQLDTWAIPTGDPSTYLPPFGHFLLWADDQEIQGIFHTNFKLASGGEFLGLYESDSVTVIDSITIPAMIQDRSYMRCQSGWTETTTPTPLAQNGCSASIEEINTIDDLFNITVNNNGEIVIDIIDYSQGEYGLQLYSMDGKEVITESLKEEKTVLNPQFEKSGIYIIIISAQNAIYSKRIWVN
ncbi:MAG: T9SS type A sorting domain-containing protein [Crocinitomicaceae bacterium]|nr:T9SS type A sorting domain-containing protein [Crocinitomicaceae bacterium]